MRYYSAIEQSAAKHQLKIMFDDSSCIAFTVAMYGGMCAYKGVFDNPYTFAQVVKNYKYWLCSFCTLLYFIF
jgi:hypothetical protein